MRVRIGDRIVGDGAPALLVAELSANHGRDLGIALRTIDAAAEAGADAIKLQTYTADTITFRSDAELFRVGSGTAWQGRTLWDLYDEAHTPWEWHPALFERARARGLLCFSSPFDPTAVDLLEGLGAPAYKVASFEIVDIPLIRAIAALGKPVILSTGIATLQEIEDAVAACREAGNDQVIVLKCTSAYPADPAEANLRTMADMRERFGTLVGLSDHTVTHAAAMAAVALGACVIEKHVILDRAVGGPDAAFSCTPEDFAEMASGVRQAEEVLGHVTYEPTAATRASRQFARSLFVVADVEAGDIVTEANVRSIRPSDGLPPRELPSILGSRFRAAVRAGTPLAESMLEREG